MSEEQPPEKPEGSRRTAFWQPSRARIAGWHERLRDRLAEGDRAHWSKRFPFVPLWAELAGAFAILVLLVVAFWDWNILRGPLERMASNAIGRQVTIGNVGVDFGWTSRVTLDRVSVANPDWAQSQSGHDMARIDRIVADVRVVPLLLAGGLIMPQVDIQNPSVELLREKGGLANWRFGNGEEGDDLHLPAIGQMFVDKGHVHVVDRAHALEFTGSVASHSGTNWDTARGFVLSGSGSIGGHPFTATVAGDTPLRADRTNPYAFDAHMNMGASRIAARGTIPRPFNLDAVVAALDVSGDDMANLYYLTGLVFPDTPAYHVSGTLTRDGDIWRFERVNGTVGHSDIAGRMKVDATNARPFLAADVTSNSADAGDFAALFGGRAKSAAPSVKAANPHAAAVADAHWAARAATDSALLMLPDAPLDVARVRQMDADVHYTAHAIKTGSVPMRDLTLGVKLDHGVLIVDPMRVTLALGKLSGRARMDARREVPDVDLDAHLTDAKLETVFHISSAVAGAEPVAGAFEMRAHLHGHGLSVRQAVVTADGDIRLAVPHGEIRKAIAELLGINVINGLGLVWSGDESKTALRCAVADFHVQGGALTVRRFVIDTDVVMATGSGEANLRDETMNLRLDGHPKKFRIGRIMAPITVTGPWAHPHVGVDARKAVAQAGIGAVLGALVTPVAAIIPFISTGTAHDVDCGRLLAGGPGVQPASD